MQRGWEEPSLDVSLWLAGPLLPHAGAALQLWQLLVEIWSHKMFRMFSFLKWKWCLLHVLPNLAKRCAGQKPKPCPASVRKTCAMSYDWHFPWSRISLKYLEFVCISGSKSQLKINKSTLKHLKNKETQTTVWTKLTLTRSQLTILSGACYISRWLIPPHLPCGKNVITSVAGQVPSYHNSTNWQAN